MASLISNAVSGATVAAHSAAVSLASASQIKAGSALPDIDIQIDSVEGKVNFSKLQGRYIIALVPGAFTPSCSSQVPGFIEKSAEIKAKGIKDIYVASVNDIFVMNAWKAKLAGDKQTDVKFAADFQGAFASGTGLIFDAGALLGGPRAKRAAIIAQDGKVEQVFVEANPPDVTVSSAESVLSKL